VGASTSHNPVGLDGQLQGYLCLLPKEYHSGVTKRVNLAVTLCICIREVLGSNMGWDTAYSGRFNGIPTGKCRLPSQSPFQFINQVDPAILTASVSNAEKGRESEGHPEDGPVSCGMRLYRASDVSCGTSPGMENNGWRPCCLHSPRLHCLGSEHTEWQFLSLSLCNTVSFSVNFNIILRRPSTK
jgi:hypothetical protein